MAYPARMLTWKQFRDREPELAKAGRSLLYKFGVGLAYLATIRRDGGPRLHPICPLLTGEGLFAFIVPSPKRDDLRRDGRYTLHSFPAEDDEDAFSLTGRASPIEDARVREALTTQYLKERALDASPPGFEDQQLFEFGIDRCLYTRTVGHGDPNPVHLSWRAPGDGTPDAR